MTHERPCEEELPETRALRALTPRLARALRVVPLASRACRLSLAAGALPGAARARAISAIAEIVLGAGAIAECRVVGAERLGRLLESFYPDDGEAAPPPGDPLSGLLAAAARDPSWGARRGGRLDPCDRLLDAVVVGCHLAGSETLALDPGRTSTLVRYRASDGWVASCAALPPAAGERLLDRLRARTADPAASVGAFRMCVSTGGRVLELRCEVAFDPSVEGDGATVSIVPVDAW